jgi:HEAT repeat protein
MRITPLALSAAAILVIASASLAGAPAAKVVVPELTELNGLIAQFKSYVADSSAAPPAPAQLAKFADSIVAAALPTLESEDAGTIQAGHQATLDFAFHVSRPGAETERAAFAKALADKIGAAKPQAQMWMCRLAQHMGKSECVAAISALLSSKDEVVRECARRALDKNPAPEAGAALVASLEVSDVLAWRAAVVNALADRGDPSAVPAIARCLTSNDVALVSAAAYGLGKIGGPEALKALQAAKIGAPKANDALLDGLLMAADSVARKGDIAVAAAVYKGLDADSSPPRIRMAALRGTIITGGEASLPVLTEALTGSDQAKRSFALSLLPEIRGDAGTKVLIALMPKLSAEEQSVVVGQLAARGDASVKPALLEALKSPEAGVRSAAVTAMGAAGDESAMPTLVDLIVKAANEGDRRAVLQSATAICTRAADKEACSKAVIAGLSDAKGAARVALVSLLAPTGTKTALASALSALKDTDADVQTAAVKALGEWPSAAPAADLLAIAKGEPSAKQAAAIRGYIRLASLNDVVAADRAKMYQDILTGVKRPEDKALALSEMGNFPTAGALVVITPLLAGDSKDEAAAAIVKIAANVMRASPTEAKDALQKVADSSASDTFKNQATQALGGTTTKGKGTKGVKTAAPK